jgi:hypothetical protein
LFFRFSPARLWPKSPEFWKFWPEPLRCRSKAESGSVITKLLVAILTTIISCYFLHPGTAASQGALIKTVDLKQLLSIAC